MNLVKLKKFANSWVGFILIMAVLFQGIRYWQNHAGKSAFAQTGLPQYSLSEAKKIASADNKLIVAELSAYWCGTCQELDHKLFTQAAVKQALTENFVYSRVMSTSDEAKLFMDTYGAQGYPTLVLLNSSGQLIKQLPLTLNGEEFISSLAP